MKGRTCRHGCGHIDDRVSRHVVGGGRIEGEGVAGRVKGQCTGDDEQGPRRDVEEHLYDGGLSRRLRKQNIPRIWFPFSPQEIAW